MRLPRGMFEELKRCVDSSLGITFPSEPCVGTSTPAMHPPNDAGGNMVCDPDINMPTVNGITAMTQEKNTVYNGSNSAPGNGGVLLSRTLCIKEFLTKYDILRNDFTHYAAFLLNLSAGGDPESDKVKFCISTVVKFLQEQLEKTAEAAVLELTRSDEACEAEIAQLHVEFDEEINDVLVISESKIRELINCHFEELSKGHSPQCHLRGVQYTFQWPKLKHYKRKAHLDEKMTKIPKTHISQDVKNTESMLAQRIEYLETKPSLSQEAARASDQEVLHLKSSMEEKEKAVKELKAETRQLKSKCQKLEAQLAESEKKAAQESLTSVSYAEDYTNPSLLDDACKSVDKATENLIRHLNYVSITSNSTAAKWKDRLEHFLGEVSSASLANFSRPVQVKYVWGHWICSKMFKDFEHVFFDTDDRSRTSPLDTKVHALECFQSFQQKKHMPSLKLYEGCAMFQAFCVRKYASVFPFEVVDMALHPQSAHRISWDGFGRFSSDDEIFRLFLDVAKAIWLLHELAFSFDPPASVLRMAAGSPFHRQFLSVVE